MRLVPILGGFVRAIMPTSSIICLAYFKLWPVLKSSQLATNVINYLPSMTSRNSDQWVGWRCWVSGFSTRALQLSRRLTEGKKCFISTVYIVYSTPLARGERYIISTVDRVYSNPLNKHFLILAIASQIEITWNLLQII